MSPFARAVALFVVSCGVVPLWAARMLPVVDLPQHLHLISVLHRLDDPGTLYGATFEARGELTPYLGFYYAVHALHWLFSLEVANRIFLSATVALLPVSLAFLLKSLGRPRWPALLSVPFAFGDSFGWGFINYCSAVPLAILACGLFVRTLLRPAGRAIWWALTAIAGVATLLFHVQAYVYLGLAIPILAALTPQPDPRIGHPVHSRSVALAAALPSLALFMLWFGGRMGTPPEIEYGAPWKAWGPTFSPQNLAYKTFAQNLHDAAPILANLFRDRSDTLPVWAVLSIWMASWGLGAWPAARVAAPEVGRARWRLPALAAAAWFLYFALPFDVRGYAYYLNPRYAHLAAALTVATLPALRTRWTRALTLSAAAAALLLGTVLTRGFRRFDREANALQALAAQASPRARVMGLVFNPGSEVASKPVYLHAAASVARASGGLANFSFALTPHSPLRYRGVPPPTFPSEWRPADFRYSRYGSAYDHFVGRGIAPRAVFGELLDGELELVTGDARFWLVRRRAL